MYMMGYTSMGWWKDIDGKDVRLWISTDHTHYIGVPDGEDLVDIISKLKDDPEWMKVR